MKAILIKTPEQLYKLKFYNDEDMLACATALLSKQNCDEIFAVVDVEKLAEELKVGTTWKDLEHLVKKGIIIGFNKAMELNRFTLEDMRKAYEEGYLDEHSFEVVIQSLQQPTEIDVEIMMSNIYVVPEPLIDSENCLILKKI